jgi:hypothetical protein
MGTMAPPARPGARVAAALACLALGAVARPAAAEECIKSWRLDVDLPLDGSRVPPNARPRVRVYETCASFTGGPRPEVRLVTAAGAAVATRPVALPRWYFELVPAAPLSPGRYRLEARRTQAPDRLGPWERVATFEVAGAAEGRAPTFTGVERGESDLVEGTVFLSPCQGERGHLVRTRLDFARARLARPHAEVLYFLEGRRDGVGAWQVINDFRPSGDGALARYEWTQQRGYGERWQYRLRARDLAGHETIGERTLVVRHPPSPPRTRR